MLKRLWGRIRRRLGWETSEEYARRKMLEMFGLPNATGGEQAECLYLVTHRGTLRGFDAFLGLLGIPRAKIYEVTDAHTILLLVPPGTDPGLKDVIEGDYVPLGVQVVMFPTLGWWECRWHPYQPVSWDERLSGP
jgi:hypothetical protein